MNCNTTHYRANSSSVPGDPTYTYTYAALGELLAWIVGWSLILEYTVAASAVAVGWSSHFVEFIQAAGWSPPNTLLHGLAAGGLIDVPAVLISAVITVLLVIGTRESATVNLVLVGIKLAALILFVVLTSQAFDSSKFTPFMPFGFNAHVDPDGVKRGVLAAAALVFFAFYGFDTVSTAAEETKNPGRNLTIGIIGSMVLCTAIYMAVAATALGASSYLDFSKNGAPLVYILSSLNHGVAAQWVAAAAIIALPTVILVLMYGQSRIFFVMARDGLLPRSMASVHASRGTPVFMTVVTGIIVAAIAATFDLSQIALLANAGTLFAFMAVAASMLVLHVRDPNRPRVFKTPMPWVVGLVCIGGCLYLFWNGLPQKTQIWFVLWNGIGLILYFGYSMRRSKLATAGGN